MNRAIFLDRDGIINEPYVIANKPYPPNCVEATKVEEGIKELLEYFKRQGFLTIIITNQPDVANGIQDRETVEKINCYLMDKLSIDDIFVCFHSEENNCICRKPKTKLFELAKEKYNIDFSSSYLIGDRWSDVEAGKNIGATTIFVNYQYDEKKPDNPDFIVKQVSEIINIFKGKLNGD